MKPAIQQALVSYIKALVAEGAVAIHTTSVIPTGCGIQMSAFPSIDPQLLGDNIIYHKSTGWFRAPRFEHDCCDCRFKGVVNQHGAPGDVYHCEQHDEFVVRFGNEPHDNIAVSADRLNKMGFDG